MIWIWIWKTDNVKQAYHKRGYYFGNNKMLGVRKVAYIFGLLPRLDYLTRYRGDSLGMLWDIKNNWHKDYKFM